uniref:ParE toxin of type II toxin-antitoxin system, parDE n=1 Tax=Candidatus Kentrum sp. DK TaxID=2126562 RepID=A0A450RZR4_9GAMM|nr:MAG: ParE toxin of type II toxin-antitoxin system, parDE [Candidatus Kentron sp. DK]
MGLAVRWSPEAVEDLAAITEYIARDSEFYARAVASKILATSRTIPEQPFGQSGAGDR